MPAVHPIDKASRLPVLSRLLYRLCFPRLSGSTYGGSMSQRHSTRRMVWSRTRQHVVRLDVPRWARPPPFHGSSCWKRDQLTTCYVYLGTSLHRHSHNIPTRDRKHRSTDNRRTGGGSPPAENPAHLPHGAYAA